MFEAKGVGVKAIADCITNQLGSHKYELWFHSLPKTSQDIFKQAILPSAWYPGKESVIIPQQKYCDLFFDGDITKVRQIGAYSAKKTLTGVYKIFVKVGSATWLIKRGSQLFERYYRPGTVHTTLDEPNHIIREIRGINDSSGLLANRIAGFLEQALTISKVKSYTINIIPAKNQELGFQFDCYWE